MFSDPPDDTSGDLVRYRGEVVRVLSVDPGNQVTLHGMVRDVYRTADSAGVRKISYLTGVGIENLHILNPEPGKHVGSMVALRGVRDFVVDNVSMDGADGIGLRLDHCLDGQVTRIRARDFDDDTASGRLGYGLAVMRATENVIVSNCHWQNMRHAVTTGGRNNERGVPRNVMITDCSADLMSDYAFDTHVQGSGITFNSCSVTNSRRGGFHIRSPDTHVMQCQVNWSPVGVSVERCGHGSSVKGGVMRHLIRTEDIGGHGLHVRRARRVLFDGVTVDGCSQNAVWQGAGTDETIIRNLTVINPNVDGVSRPAIFQESGGAFAGTVIDNNMIRAYSESTPEPLSSGRMSHGIEMSSRATGYEVTRNSVRGHNGSVVQTNGSSGLVSDNVDLDRA
jgi:hypothetical protein